MSEDAERTELTERVKAYAQSFSPWEDVGADLVGVITAESLDAVPSYWVGWEINDQTKKTGDYMEGARSVIVLGYHAWDDVCEMISFKGDRFEAYAYMRMEINARKLVRWLRRQGHAARIAGDLLPKKRMAQLAGFGGFGKNALIINPRYGPWLRLQAVLTDVELEPDKPYEGDLCGDCEECVKACPVGALTPYVVDPNRCLAGPHDDEWIGLLSGQVSYDSIKDGPPGLQKVFDVHSPTVTRNTRLMCMTCQRACPIGREERGL
ncbi:epoxyqueuosine reductase [Candidatus Bathyarchaeota archaeon]|nr:epoxyqueuosine reductase [Candidatus Bathyarchaeota archaeon]